MRRSQNKACHLRAKLMFSIPIVVDKHSRNRGGLSRPVKWVVVANPFFQLNSGKTASALCLLPFWRRQRPLFFETLSSKTVRSLLVRLKSTWSLHPGGSPRRISSSSEADLLFAETTIKLSIARNLLRFYMLRASADKGHNAADLSPWAYTFPFQVVFTPLVVPYV